jgi:hypothetical protein
VQGVSIVSTSNVRLFAMQAGWLCYLKLVRLYHAIWCDR